MTKQEQLNKLNIYWKENCKCELRKTATQAVFGDGNAEAEVVFIGEAPGKNEDLKGIPFVGSAGKFLKEMLKAIGKKREDIYITNIVKYRPPNNRDPKPKEKADCNLWLINELKINCITRQAFNAPIFSFGKNRNHPWQTPNSRHKRIWQASISPALPPRRRFV